MPQGLPRRVAASRGGSWIAQGFDLFKAAPSQSIAMFVVWTLILLACQAVPYGSAIFLIASPALGAGWMLAFREAAEGRAVRVAQLFGGFRGERLRPLLMIGLAYLVGLAVAQDIAMLAANEKVREVLAMDSSDLLADPNRVMNLLDLEFLTSILLCLLLTAGLTLPVVMATWFAPALVIFDQQGPVEAMKQSLVACTRNAMPFLVYGLIGAGLTLVALLPLGLGLLVLVPVFIASIYTSYRDIFDRLADRAPAAGG